MGYIPPERPLMPGESRRDWYLERRKELLKARDYNKSMLDKWSLIIVITIFVLCFIKVILK